MRVALITGCSYPDASYPYVKGGAGDWCHRLLHGLDQHTFHLVALAAEERPREPAYTLPPNALLHPIGDRRPAPAGRPARFHRRRAATAAAVLLCRGLLSDTEQGAAMFAQSLRLFADLAGAGAPLRGVPLADVLLDAWQAAGAGPALPRLSVRDARRAADHLAQALRPLAVRVPAADLCHAAGAGPPLLVALATRWRAGTPFLLTEERPIAAAWSPDRASGRSPAPATSAPAAVKAVLLRYHRALRRLGYAEAALVASASRFQQRWELRDGADPAKVVVVPNGVEPMRYAPLETEPAAPAVVWAGQIAPHKDLHTLIRAFRQVRDAVPHAGLRLAGPATDLGYADTCRRLVDRLRLGDSVAFVGPVPSSREAYATGHVVASSSVSEHTPDTLVEAMLCARPTVSTDVGAAAEAVGDAGVLVPPGDPVALGAACIELLRDPERRRRLGAAGRARALRLFTVDGMRRAYDHLYQDVAARPGQTA
ncbi:GT4 family glycosyltransferase PelF [Phytohabitans suffuscus]|uniref:Lipopolysaccharide glycosyltransferase, putative n=1 Tax=Phytohabitans suffuscus TaxID=624315 RepID=A0A6F8YNJ0_9ACTN|nr:GT4 family glycosyltransferase PelF [Phytohabitans suffuscus]BCB87563.1 lipopolysaccharide glycosyltransferase, putative [Phytohabitans suffuscus]